MKSSALFQNTIFVHSCGRRRDPKNTFLNKGFIRVVSSLKTLKAQTEVPMRAIIVLATLVASATSSFAQTAAPATRLATVSEFSVCAEKHKLGGDARYPLRKEKDFTVLGNPDPRENAFQWKLKKAIQEGPHGPAASAALKACERVAI